MWADDVDGLRTFWNIKVLGLTGVTERLLRLAPRVERARVLKCVGYDGAALHARERLTEIFSPNNLYLRRPIRDGTLVLVGTHRTSLS